MEFTGTDWKSQKKKKKKEWGGIRRENMPNVVSLNLQGIEISQDSVDCLLCAVARCTPSGSHMTL